MLAPSSALHPYIQRILIVEYTSGWSTTLLPGTGLVLAFRFRGECLINNAGIWNLLGFENRNLGTYFDSKRSQISATAGSE